MREFDETTLSGIPGDISAAIEAGKQIGAMQVSEVNDIPAVMVPQGMELKLLEEHMDAPKRLEQTVSLDTVDSFIEYFNAFCDDRSVIFCDIDAGKFSGVLDYHGNKDPSWCEHEVKHICKTTKEWQSWKENNGKQMDQIQFAFFLEQNLDEIVKPEAAEMLEIALTLKAKTKTHFESGNRLTDGQVQFRYHEEIEGGAGASGEIKIPETFSLGLRVLEGGDAYAMDARFRYRIREGKVTMWYDLVRPHKVYQSAVEDVFKKIKADAKARMVLHGSL